MIPLFGKPVAEPSSDAVQSEASDGRAAVATRMSLMTALSGYVLELLREGADFTLYRGQQHGNPSAVQLPRCLNLEKAKLSSGFR
jgi:hypothetical protein